MISRMTALVVCSMAITSIFVLGTQGEISITSEPEKIVHSHRFTLTCHIGAVTDEVKWVYKGITYFSCVSPYSAGQCFINTTAPYSNRPSYDVNTTAGISTIRMYTVKNQLDGLWTCHHGRHISTYNVSPFDFNKRAYITSFTSSPSSRNIHVGITMTLTCTVSSTTLLPVDVSISSKNRERNLTYVTNSISRSVTVSTIVQCIDYWFFCTVYNGYGSVSTENFYKIVTCPATPLPHKTKTTVNATVGSYGYLYAYYSGYPLPSFTWYRRLSQVEAKMNSYRTYRSYGGGQNKFTFLRIDNVHLEDAGEYSVHINNTGKDYIVVFTLNVNPAPTSNSIAKEQTSETLAVDALQQNSTMKAVDVPQQNFTIKGLCSATTQPFISAAGLGIGIAVGVVITLLVQGVVLLVSRMLKSRDVKDKDVKTKSTKKGQDKRKSMQADYENTSYIPADEETYDNLEVRPN